MSNGRSEQRIVEMKHRTESLVARSTCPATADADVAHTIAPNNLVSTQMREEFNNMPL